MRFAVTVVLWLATTVALAAAVPAAWTQLHVVDADGYAALAQRAAADPALQSAMASELTTRAMALVAARAGGRFPVDGAQVHDAAVAFTAGRAFPPLFAHANRAVHGWLFDDPGRSDGEWAVDLAPMLRDSAIAPLLSRQHVTVPPTLTVPVTASMPHALRRGQLRRLSAWAPWVTLGVAILERGLRRADAARRPAPRQGAERAGRLGAARRRGRVGRHRDRPQVRQRRPQPHHRRHPRHRRGAGRPRRSRPAPMA